MPAAPAIDHVRHLTRAADVVALMKLTDGAAAPAEARLPSLANWDTVVSFIRDNYPQELRGDTTHHEIAFFWACIGVGGGIERANMIGGTGVAVLDTLAQRAIRISRFHPITVKGKDVAMWVPIPVQVSPFAGKPKPTPKNLEDSPTFTPYTVKPELTNREEVSAALVKNYPPEMLKQRVSGTTVVWLLIDETGWVVRTQVRQGSGSPELDLAAQKVAKIMRFTPALNRGAPVKVWIQLPIVFRVP